MSPRGAATACSARPATMPPARRSTRWTRSSACAVRATGYRTAVLGGGVACNRTLAGLAAQRLSGLARVAVASPRLNADNAAMIARAGWHRLALGERSDWTLDARADLPLPGLETA